MSISKLVQSCHRLGIVLAVKDGRLHLQAPKGVLSAHTVDFIKKHKEAVKEHLLATLSSQSCLSSDSTVWDDQQEAYEERAAIMEYDGGLTRIEAEQAAKSIMAKATC